MTDRKPDFYVVRVFDRVENKTHYLSSSENKTHYLSSSGYSVLIWTEDKAGRARYATVDDAKHAASLLACPTDPVPVFCTSKRAEPKMRERSSSWVLKRLAEGKVVLALDSFHRFDAQEGIIENFVQGKWSQDVHGFCTSGRVLCRIAKPEEVPT